MNSISGKSLVNLVICQNLVKTVTLKCAYSSVKNGAKV